MSEVRTVRHPFSAKIVNKRPPTHEIFRIGDTLEILKQDGGDVIFRRSSDPNIEFAMAFVDLDYKTTELVHS